MSRLVPGTIRAVLSGQRPVIRSDGTFLRDYFYVKDGAAAYLHLAECLAGEPQLAGHAFNFSTEKPLSVLQLVDADFALDGIGLDARRSERGQRTKSSINIFPPRKPAALLDWRPLYSLDRGARRNYRLVSRLFLQARGIQRSGTRFSPRTSSRLR